MKIIIYYYFFKFTIIFVSLIESKKIHNTNNKMATTNQSVDNNLNYLSQLVYSNSIKNQNSNSTNSILIQRKILRVINNLMITSSANESPGEKITKCNTRLLQSDVQAEMKRLKSFITTCPSYCRLAMSLDGTLTGAREFSLESIWTRMDVSHENLMLNMNLFGSYHIKFLLANKYLCINSEGDLYASDNRDNKDCLWLNSSPKIFSTTYDFHLNLNSICNKPTTTSEYSKLINLDQCKTDNYLNIVTGYSHDIKNFFQQCQNQLLKQSYSIMNLMQSSTTSTSTSTKIFKPIFNKNKQVIVQRHSNINNKLTTSSIPATTSSNSIDLKSLCKNYLNYDELIYKEGEKRALAEFNDQTLPKVCQDYLIAQKKIIKKTSNSNEINSNEVNTNKFKKCYKFREKPNYFDCMNKHYKCYQYANDIENLKKCRKLNGITVANKIVKDYTDESDKS